MGFFIDSALISIVFLSSRTVDCFQVVNQLNFGSTILQATVAPITSPAESAVKGVVLEEWTSGKGAAEEYAEMFGLGQEEAGFYGLFEAMRKAGIAYGLKGHPFVLRKDEIADLSAFDGFFTMKDLAKALDDDFLDAARGSTDNRKGWKVRLNAETRCCCCASEDSFNPFWCFSTKFVFRLRLFRPLEEIPLKRHG